MAMIRFNRSVGKKVIIVTLCMVAMITVLAAPTDRSVLLADEAQNVFMPPDRATMRKLLQSNALIEQGRYGEAVRFLGEILEEPEDFFIRPNADSPIYRSLKTEAERIIGRLPSKGRELYELQFGAEARRMLTDALESGDVLRLAEVSRRFFHTSSGYEAALLLGLHHFDHNRPLAGALVLQRLENECTKKAELEPTLSLTIAACWLQAGMPDKARESLKSLRERDPMLRVLVAGREVPLFTDDAKAIGWLTDLIGHWPECETLIPKNWLMFRGNSSRNAPTEGGSPLLSKRWRVPITDDPLIESSLTAIVGFRDNIGAAIPLLHPLVVDDVLLMRTVRNLVAVDFKTGKRLWDVPVTDQTEPAALPNVGNIRQQPWLALLGKTQRVCGDLTYGTMSSDGRLVFSVEDLGLEYGNDSQAIRQVIIMGRVGRRVSRTGVDTLCNRLAAHDVRTGKLVWELGGPDGKRGLRQSDTFFLGPPLPLMGKLYVLAEAKGEVRLMALDSSTGDLLWSQQISLVEQSVLTAVDRRWVGVSPSYDDGILVCPTSTGAVVGVELATRSLLWGYCYDQNRNNRRRSINLNNLRNGMSSPNRWIDGGVLIHDGRVLLTPQDSNFLHCVSLIDGELFWKENRKNDIYLACVHEGKAVLVGLQSVRAFNLSDGKPAWEGKAAVYPGEAAPSGRGFVSGDKYYLPLSTAEVAAIDLSEGKIDGVSKSQDGVMPGNLICHDGMVVSQGLHGVDAYFQLDVALAEAERRLKADPDDAWALSLRGEIQLDAGKRSEAIGYFRRAFELSNDPRSREMLRDSLLEGLRTEFAVYRDRDTEIEKLLDDSTQHAKYLRLMASGLKDEKEWDGAFERYLALIDLEPGRPPLDQVAPGYVVRRDRWIREQLSDLRKEASGEPAKKIDEYVSVRLEAAKAADKIVKLRRFLDYFGGVPVAEPAKADYLRRLNSDGNKLAVELLSPSSKPAQKTKKYNVDWPKGNVEAKTEKTKNLAKLNNRYYSVNLLGDPGPYFRDLTVKYEYRTKAITVFDGFGRKLWTVPITDKKQPNNIPINYSQIKARAVGHLLLVATGWRVLAIDTVDLDDEGAPRVIWNNDFTDSFAGANGGPGNLPIPMGLLPRQLQAQLFNRGNQAGLLGASNNSYVCLRRFNDIVALDPLSGETLWARQDFPNSCDIFGDENHLFVLSTDHEEAVLLRAEDGRQSGERKLPRRTVRRGMPNGKIVETFTPLKNSAIGTVGRKLLLWWLEGNQRELTLVDPLEQRDEWPRRKFSSRANACVIENEVVGVVEPDGRFVLISILDGKTLADVKLKFEANYQNATLTKLGDQYFLLINHRPKSGRQMPIQPMPNQSPNSRRPIYNGRLYAFDLEGKMLWPEPVKITNQMLITDQFDGLPVLIFACQHYKRKPNGRAQWKHQVLCIDKRTGRKVYKEEFDGHINIFAISCNAESKTISLTMQKDTVTLAFTDNPIPPPAAEEPEPAEKKPGSKIAHALWNSIRKTFVPNIESFDLDRTE